MSLTECHLKTPYTLKKNKEENKKYIHGVDSKSGNEELVIKKSIYSTDANYSDADFEIIELKYSLPYIPNEYNLWHKNKQKAWKLIPSCPSLYYFFYLAPGLHEATYPPKEKEFVESLRVYPPQLNGWGLFSLHLPGYTGKQCYDYYMTLLSEKKVSGKYKSLPVFQKTDIMTYYTAYLNACKSYTATVKEEHHHKAPAYNRHNDNHHHHHNKKQKVDKDKDEDDDDEEDEDDIVIENRKIRKNKSNKHYKKKKSTSSYKKNKSKKFKYIVDDDSPEEISLSEEDDDDVESDLFSVTTDENSHAEEEEEEDNEDEDDEDSVIKLVRKKLKKNVKKQEPSNTTPISNRRSSDIEITPSTTKSIELTPPSSISIRNDVESSPFLTPASSIMSVKTTPDYTNDKESNDSINNISEVHTPESERIKDDSTISPPPAVKRSNIEKSAYYKTKQDDTNTGILDSPISDDSTQMESVNQSKEVENSGENSEEEKYEEKMKDDVEKELEYQQFKKSLKTIVMRKRKLDNISEGYSNKKQKNLISLLSRDYTILPEIKIPCEDVNVIPYEYQMIKYHCEMEFRRLTQMVINSIELLSREYHNVNIQSDKSKVDKMYKYVVDELKHLENKYNEGIIDIQRRYNAEYSIVKSFGGKIDYNDENLLCNTYINPFYL